MCIYLINYKWKPRFATNLKIKEKLHFKSIKHEQINCLTSTDSQIQDVCVKLGEGGTKLVIARGSTGAQGSGFRFRCGVQLLVLYCLTSYSSLCPWIEYQEIVICIYMYYRRAIQTCRSRHGRDRMVVGLTTTCTISAYHLQSCEFESSRWRGVLDTILSDWVCQWFATGLLFSPGTPVSSTNKTDRHIFNWHIVESGIKDHNNNLNPTNIYLHVYAPWPTIIIIHKW